MAANLIHQPGIDWESYSDHRTPGISIKKLLQRGGDAQFEFNLVRFAGDEFHAPRHRHNFDQIRIGLAGTTKYGTRERLTARTIGYYPEGCWYGPTTVQEPSVQAILQLDGPGRLGYVNYVAHDEAVAALKERGEFRGGLYFPADGGPSVDGYQAGWEEATGRAMVYPEPRFEFPIYMKVDAFAWLDDGSPIQRKTLGVFGERGTALDMALVPAGESLSVGGGNSTTVAFVLSGELDAAGGSQTTWSATLADGADPIELTGVAPSSELILVTFPTFG